MTCGRSFTSPEWEGNWEGARPEEKGRLTMVTLWLHRPILIHNLIQHTFIHYYHARWQLHLVQAGSAQCKPCTEGIPAPWSSCWWRLSERSPSHTVGSSGSGRRGLSWMVACNCSPWGTTSVSTEGGRLAFCPPNPLLVSLPPLSLIICTEVTVAVQQQHYPWPAGVTAGPGRLESCPSQRGLFTTVLVTSKSVDKYYWGMRQKIEVCARNCSISLQLQLQLAKDRHFVYDWATVHMRLHVLDRICTVLAVNETLQLHKRIKF